MWIVEELENSIDIVELVWKYASLKKAWVNYKALCPFPGHSEKTPSFVVSPSKQIWYCFGCHKWWWAIKFIMDIENCEFKEAVEILSSITWVKVNSNFDPKKNEVKKNIYSLYKDSVNYYKQALENYPEIKKYLFDRGINTESIKNFHIWYSDSWLKLYNYLKEKWYDDQIISQSNIFLDIKTKKDKFINRVIFPIQNLRWDFVAFTARVLWNGEPKYLNSPASNIYDKSSILYWLYNARTSITKEDFIIVVEWNADAIAMQQFWFINSVAISWTALTDKHLQIIKRLTKKIYICFDNDSAWEKATKLSLENLKNKDFEVKIILLKWGKDPDEILQKWWDFQKLIDEALSPVWYYIKKSKWDKNSIEDKKNLLIELLSLIKSYSNDIEKDFYLKETSKLLKISEKIIYDEFNKIRLKYDRNLESISKRDSYTSQELAIWYILIKPDLADELEKNIVFRKDINKDLNNFLKEPEDYLKTLDLEKKERFRAIWLFIEWQIENKAQKEILENIEKLAKKINIDIYKKLSSSYKKEIENGNIDYLEKYSNLIKTAKLNNIK